MNDIDVNLVFRDTGLDAISADISKIKNDLDGLNKNTNNVNTSFGSMSTLGKALGGIFAGIGLSQLALDALKAADNMKLLNTSLTRVSGGDADRARSKFQELSKLSNDLGVKTNELTETYIKLANRGFKPTAQEIVKLSDIARANSKSIDQLAEAILDASTGEFERLKEFGIRASKSGNDVSFTFNGVTKTVKNTSDEINKAILSFGDLASIQGASAAAANTLEAAQNRLSNTVTKLAANFGELGGGVASGTVNFFSGLVQSVNDVLFPAKALTEAMENQRDTVANLEKNVPRLTERYKTLSTQKKLNKKEQEELNAVTKQLAEIAPLAATGLGDYTTGLRINLDALKQYTAAQKENYKIILQNEVTLTRNRLTNITLEQRDLERQQQNLTKYYKTSAEQAAGNRGILLQDQKLRTERLEVERRSIEAQEQLKILLDGGVITQKKFNDEAERGATAQKELSKEEQDRIKKLKDELTKLLEKAQEEADKASGKLQQTNELNVQRQRELALQEVNQREQEINDLAKKLGRKVDVTKQFEQQRLEVEQEYIAKLRDARQKDLQTALGIEETFKVLENSLNNIDFSNFKLKSNATLVQALLDPKEFEKQFKELSKITDEEKANLDKAVAGLVNNVNSNFSQLLSPLENIREKIKGIFGIDDEQLDFAIGQFQEFGNALKGFFASQNEAAAQAQEDLARQLDERISATQKALDIELDRKKAGSANSVEETQKELDTIQQQRTNALQKAQEERQKAQRVELIADGISQASNLITAGSNIIKNFSKVPFVGIILGLAAVGTMLAGFATLKNNANAAIPKYRKGRRGYQVEGRTHEEGGELAELERNEFVIDTATSKKQHKFLNRMMDGEFDNMDLDRVFRRSEVVPNSADRAREAMFAYEAFKDTQFKMAIESAISKQTAELIKHDKSKPSFIAKDGGYIEVKENTAGGKTFNFVKIRD